ncbi:MAG TPA: acetyl-CoA C-acetyltransferase [Stackebrandtia sp.]|jgi:acetyl-CoA C-acetyltransferase|uniref:acetyl-CoA C-acetyltransferase n=1 Tax=Stackebrandtia sp. TaxID=2023065 RepID=UPI002D48EDC6|nr:acetyl-CoA C-acetyltransferase [Stackebrandtia sp.]HZE39242.1 acetyl-CoA C-acetyltransferase [Stackebrandtia sp.]
MSDAFIYDWVRTPRGKGKRGSLHSVKPVSLAAGLLNSLAERNTLDTSAVDDVVLGCVTPINEQGGDIARTAVLSADWAMTTGGVQIDRFCASGLEAVNLAAAKTASGFEDLVVAGGVESMSRNPMASDGGAWFMDPETNLRTGFVPQGVSADLIATLEGYGRRDVDQVAVESHERAAEAWKDKRFARSVVPVLDANGQLLLDTDETVRPGTSLESLAGLKPSFTAVGGIGFDQVAIQRYPQVESINHVHHAGNSSGIVDGAAVMMVGSAAGGRAAGLTPRARIVSTAVVGSEPTIMLTGPAASARKALARARMAVGDIDLFEMNEAFAAAVLKFRDDLGVGTDVVNVNGGAIAMGHPLGATGCMILGTLLDELERRDLRTGLATLCVGGGMGVSTIIERV